MGGEFSEFRERRDEYGTDESKHEYRESLDERGWEKTDSESWIKEIVKEIETHELDEDLKTEKFVREFRRELERQERIESEENQAAEEWMKAVAEEIEKMEKEEALEKEKHRVERPKGWDPTIDELGDYEKDIAKGFEVTGATEEEMTERWRESYVEEMQNIIEKEPHLEGSSSGSLEGTKSSEAANSKVVDEQSDEFVESGDGTSSTMVIEHSSKEVCEQEESNPELYSEEETGDTPEDTTESSKPVSEEGDGEEKIEDTSHESASEKKKYDTYTERPSHHRREIDNYFEEDNTEPSEKFREEYESKSKPTQFSENDRTPETLSRVVDQAERYTEYQKVPSMIDGHVESFPEPSMGKIKHSEQPEKKLRKQEVHEGNKEDMLPKESEYECSSEKCIDSEEKSTQQDKRNTESGIMDKIEQYSKDRSDYSSYEHELYQEEYKEVTSEVYEDESETKPESLNENSESQQEEVEEVIKSAMEQQTVDECIDEDEFTENEVYSSEIKKAEGRESEFTKSEEKIDSVEVPQSVERHQELETEQTIGPTAEKIQEDEGHIEKNLEDNYLKSPEKMEIERSRDIYESEMSESISSQPLNKEIEHIEETCKPVAGEEIRKIESEELEVYENLTNEKEFEVELYETNTETESQSATETRDTPFQENQLEIHLVNQIDEVQLKSKTVETETNERLLSVVWRLMSERKLPVSFNEFETLLDRNLHLHKSKNYEKKYYRAKIFYQIVDDMLEEDYSHLAARAVWKMMSEKYNIPESTIKTWFTSRSLPQLISDVIRAERKSNRLRDSYHKKQGESTITLQTPKSKTEFIRLLARHPHLRNTPNFDSMYKDVLTYFTAKDIIANNPSINISELARQLNYSRGKIQNWVRDKCRPKLIQILLMNEQLRIKYESELNQEAHNHRIEPTLVYEALRPLKEIDNLSSRSIVDVLEKLFGKQQQCKIVFAELRHYNHRKGHQGLSRIKKVINSKIHEIEKIMNKRLGYDRNPDIELRLGLIDSKLYMWTRDTSQFDFANLFADELFFFDKSMHRKIINTSRNHLGLKGSINLSELVRQMTDYKENRITSRGRLVSNFETEADYIEGRILKFLLDAQETLLKDIEEYIQGIGVGKQILKPRILDDKSLRVLMARLYAIVASDGHIEQHTHVIHYYENDDLRQEIVSSHFMKMGNVAIKKYHNKVTDGYELRAPSVLGRILAKLGMPVGDKVLQGVVIPNFIMNGPPEVQAAYLEEVIPEDGWITIQDKERDYAKISISRDIALYDSDKENKYNFENKIPESLIELFQKKAEKKIRHFGREESQVYYEFSAKSLEQLQDSKSKQIALMAKKLLFVILENPPELLVNEHSLCEMNGIIMTEPNLEKVLLSEKTGRVSAVWYISTSSQADVARWGLFAPSNDARKQSVLALWMKRHPNLIEKARLALSRL